MSRPNKLLIATDFSVSGRRAGKIAMQWAECFGMELHWAHCAEAMPDEIKASAAPLIANYIARARTYAREQLASAVKLSRDRGLTSESHFIDGQPVSRILELADEIEADLLVVGSHGHTGFKRAWVGSVAEGIVREASCPVLVARGQDSPLSGQAVLVGDDLTGCSRPAREAAIDIAACSSARVEFIHSVDLGIPYLSSLEVVVPPDAFSRDEDEARERLSKRVAELNTAKVEKLEQQVVSERPAAALCERAEELQAALVVVGCHSREGLSRVLLGSVAESVVRHAPCSVLVTRGAVHED